MPEYSKADKNFIIERNDAVKMINACSKERNENLIALLWITGARPAEIIELTREATEVNETNFIIKMPTKKKRGTGGFALEFRMLEFQRPIPPNTDDMIERVCKFLAGCPPGRIFNISTRMVEYIIGAAGLIGLGKFVCPYNFRHSRMTLLSRAGLNPWELSLFKGTTDTRSVDSYVHAKIFKVRI